MGPKTIVYTAAENERGQTLLEHAMSVTSLVFFTVQGLYFIFISELSQSIIHLYLLYFLNFGINIFLCHENKSGMLACTIFVSVQVSELLTISS